jgi:hypothetical protein
MQPVTRNSLIVLVLLAVVAIVARWDGHRAGVQDASAEHYRVLRDTIVDSIKVVEQRIEHDTIRVAIAEKKARAAIAREDSTAVAITAIADTSSVVSASLATLEVQQCHDMRDDLLDEMDTLKVTVADERAGRALEHRGRLLAEAEVKRVTPSRFDRFKVGVIVTVVVDVAAHVVLRR